MVENFSQFLLKKTKQNRSRKKPESKPETKTETKAETKAVPEKPMKPKQENNDPQETFKASGLTLALISSLTTRYTSTWVKYSNKNGTIEIGKNLKKARRSEHPSNKTFCLVDGCPQGLVYLTGWLK